MSRTTDEQIADWRHRAQHGWSTGHHLIDALDALEAERKRADALDEKRLGNLMAASRLMEKLEDAENTIARVRQFAHEMRGYCSPMGISMHYASQLEDVLDGRA